MFVGKLVQRIDGCRLIQFVARSLKWMLHRALKLFTGTPCKSLDHVFLTICRLVSVVLMYSTIVANTPPLPALRSFIQHPSDFPVESKSHLFKNRSSAILRSAGATSDLYSIRSDYQADGCWQISNTIKPTT